MIHEFLFTNYITCVFKNTISSFQERKKYEIIFDNKKLRTKNMLTYISITNKRIKTVCFCCPLLFFSFSLCTYIYVQLLLLVHVVHMFNVLRSICKNTVQFSLQKELTIAFDTFLNSNTLTMCWKHCKTLKKKSKAFMMVLLLFYKFLPYSDFVFK